MDKFDRTHKRLASRTSQLESLQPRVLTIDLTGCESEQLSVHTEVFTLKEPLQLHYDDERGSWLTDLDQIHVIGGETPRMEFDLWPAQYPPTDADWS